MYAIIMCVKKPLNFLVQVMHRHRNRGGTGGMCPPMFHKLLYKLHTTLCVVSDCAPPIKKSFLRLCHVHDISIPDSFTLACYWICTSCTFLGMIQDKVLHDQAVHRQVIRDQAAQTQTSNNQAAQTQTSNTCMHNQAAHRQ